MSGTARSPSSPSPIFTKEEMKNIVRSFIWAHIKGSINVLWVTNTEAKKLFVNDPEVSAALKDYDEIKVKSDFNNKVSIICGTVSSTQEEFDMALDQVFQTILSHRNGQRIVGSFLESPDLDLRVKETENQLTSINELMRNLLTWQKIVNQKLDIV